MSFLIGGVVLKHDLHEFALIGFGKTVVIDLMAFDCAQAADFFAAD
jgi:hypothetical protein